MIPGRPRCSAESLDRAEPLTATASLVNAWILIEQPGAWGPNAIAESGFPVEGAAGFVRRAEGSGIRVLLIRRRDREDGRRTVFLAYSGGAAQSPMLVSETVGDPIELIDLDLESLVQGEPQGFGRPVDKPIYLVCTHGRHDICCADHGRPLYRVMSDHLPDRTWEVSHIGGDRFAGNLLVLPRGDYFGRLEPHDAASLVDNYEAGMLDLDHHRGRSTYPRLVQAAEHFLRISRSLASFEDLELVEYRRIDHDHAEVAFRDADEIPHRLLVVARSLSGQDFLTCRAEEPGHSVAYELVSLTTG